MNPLITFSPFMVAGNILTLTNMDYLGLGLPVPTPSWGELLSQAQKYSTVAEWLVWWPSFFLVLTLVLLINIGLAIRDSFDPKSSPS
jgi:microcin C transport system permease protein